MVKTLKFLQFLTSMNQGEWHDVMSKGRNLSCARQPQGVKVLVYIEPQGRMLIVCRFQSLTTYLLAKKLPSFIFFFIFL